MKKSLYALMVAAMMFSGCSSDLEPVMNGDGNTHFTVLLPDGMGSRSFGDGESATDLTVVAYEAGTKTIGDKATATIADKAATVDLTLERGKRYDIVFWAMSAEATCYTFSEADGTVAIDYDNMIGSNDNADAFFACDNTPIVSDSYTKTIQLRRPLAQVNLGTDDLKSDWSVKTTMSAKAYTNLSLVDGMVSGQKNVAFVSSTQPVGETFPAPVDDASKEYSYLSMAYLLVPADQELVDLNFTLEREGAEAVTVPVANAPVQRNYRTNVFGSLLTANGNYNVVIVENFYDPGFPIKWGGEIVAVPEPDEQNVITITTAAQLAGVAAAVNENSNAFKGKTIKLGNDIDLNNQMWTPIGDKAAGKHFSGTIDGDGHTISNLNISGTEGVAFIGACQGVVKNINFKNVLATGNHWVGTVVGYCTDHAGTELSNITVDNARIMATPSKTADGSYSDGDKAGGIVGYIASGNPVSNCTISNSYISAFRDVAAIAGMSDDAITNCSASNTTIELNGANPEKGKVPENIGVLVGRGSGNSVNGKAVGTGMVFKYSNIDKSIQGDAAGFQPAVPGNISEIILSGLDVNSLVVNVPDGVSVVFENSTITPLDENPGNNFRMGFYYIAGNGQQSIDLTVKNVTVNGSWSHGMYVQGNAATYPTTNNNIVFENCTFSDWGKKETSEEDIVTSAAVKLYRVTCAQTEDARQEYAKTFMANNNFDAKTIATGRVKLQLTAVEDQQAVLYVFK